MARTLALDISYFGMTTPGDGVPGTGTPTQYDTLEYVNFNFAEPNELNFVALGSDDPWASVIKGGDPTSVEIGIPSPTNDEMVAFCGGEVDANGKWQAPLSAPTIVKTVIIRSATYDGKYIEYVFARMSLSGKIGRAPSAEECDLLLIKGTLLSATTAAGVRKPPYSREIVTVPSGT